MSRKYVKCIEEDRHLTVNNEYEVYFTYFDQILTVNDKLFEMFYSKSKFSEPYEKEIK